MDLNEVQTWILVISGTIGIVSSSIAIWNTLRELRLKYESEKRLSDSAKVKSDIELINSFGEALSLAHSRKQVYFTDKVVEKLLENESLKLENYESINSFKADVQNLCTYTSYAGIAEQDGFISALAELGASHTILKNPVIDSLKTIRSFKGEMVDKYITKLEKEV